MRRHDGLVRLHHVSRERALEPAVGLDDEATPRAAQERCQGRRGLGGRHFGSFFSSSKNELFFFQTSSDFGAASSGVSTSLLFSLSTFAFSLSPSNSSSLSPWPPCRGLSPHRRPSRLPRATPTRLAASSPPRPLRRRRCRRRRRRSPALLASRPLPRSAPPPLLRRDVAPLPSLRGE